MGDFSRHPPASQSPAARRVRLSLCGDLLSPTRAQEAPAGLIIGWESFGEHLRQVLAEAVLLNQQPADIPAAVRRTRALLFLACKNEGRTLSRNPSVPLTVSGEGHVTLGFLVY